MTPLILASTSIYRKELLQRLGLAFEAKRPLFDEDQAKKNDLAPQELAEFLALSKARSLSTLQNCVIGSDQIVVFENDIIGKSKTFEVAFNQLKKMSGKTHNIITAVNIVYQSKPSAFMNIAKMKMRTLSVVEIENYLQHDKPFDCAGSYKIEKKGICLFEKIEADDFTAIEGLPLIQLTTVLKKLGYPI